MIIRKILILFCAGFCFVVFPNFAQVQPTNVWISVYSGNTTLDGNAVPVNATIDVFDPDSVLCGRFVVTDPGSYGFLHVYGDDQTTPMIDEGAEQGDTLRFTINGLPTVCRGPSPAVWTSHGEVLEINLEAHHSWPPQLRSPRNKATEISTSVLLEWTVLFGFTSFELEVATDSTFQTKADSTKGILETHFRLAGLSVDTKYYWRVRNNKDSFVSQWSEIFSFTTKLTSFDIVFIPERLYFPATVLYDTSDLFLKVLNVSTNPTVLLGISSRNSAFLPEPYCDTIPPNDSVLIKMSFIPSKFGVTSDTAYLVGIGDSLAFYLEGESPFPTFTTDNNKLEFGDVGKCLTASRTLKIFNTSINLLTIDSFYTTTKYFSPNVSNAVIGKGTFSLVVTFFPDEARSYTDTLYIINNSENQIVKIPLIGNCPPGVLFVKQNNISFGDVVKGTTVRQTVNLENHSISFIILSELKTTTNNFSTVLTLPDTVSGNDSLALEVLFTPDRFGEFVDTLSIRSDGGDANIALIGFSSYPTYESPTKSMEFGTVAKNASKSDTIRISNSSINTLIVDSIYTMSPVFRVDKSHGSVIQNEVFIIAVRFKPTSGGSFQDTLYISNNSISPLIKIPLSGDCPNSVLFIVQHSINFGEVVKDSTTIKNIYLYNKSISPLIITGLSTAARTFNAELTQSDTITGRDSARVLVKFTPDSFGTFLDTLKITSDGGNANIVLSGTSPHPVLVSSVSSLDFGNVKKDSTAKIELWFTNTSINRLIIDSLFTRTEYFGYTGAIIPAIVRKNDTLNLFVTFKPDTAEEYIDTLYVLNNALLTLYKIPLKGKRIISYVALAGAGTPKTFVLEQNYPNPFNPTTTIRFGLPEQSSVKIAIYNIIGQVLEELINTELHAGYHEVIWTARHPSGIYFYRIEAVSRQNENDKFVQMRKMLLIR